MLELKTFAEKKSQYPSPTELRELSSQLDVPYIKIKVWFQNMRAKMKRTLRMQVLGSSSRNGTALSPLRDEMEKGNWRRNLVSNFSFAKEGGEDAPCVLTPGDPDMCVGGTRRKARFQKLRLTAEHRRLLEEDCASFPPPSVLPVLVGPESPPVRFGVMSQMHVSHMHCCGALGLESPPWGVAMVLCYFGNDEDGKGFSEMRLSVYGLPGLCSVQIFNRRGSAHPSQHT